MEPCHKIRPWLEWLAADEIADRERLRAEAHLRECPTCRRELSGWQALLAAAGERKAIAAAECQAIDWGPVSERIMRRIEPKEKVVEMPGRRRVFRFAPLVTAATLLLLVGAGCSSCRPGREFPAGRRGGISTAAVSHLQSGLARQEVISYLRQSQLMFTDLLRTVPAKKWPPGKSAWFHDRPRTC